MSKIKDKCNIYNIKDKKKCKKQCSERKKRKTQELEKINVIDKLIVHPLLILEKSLSPLVDPFSVVKSQTHFTFFYFRKKVYKRFPSILRILPLAKFSFIISANSAIFAIHSSIVGASAFLNHCAYNNLASITIYKN